MADKKSGDMEVVAYVFGVISIVMAFFTPLAGVVFGIIGIVQSKKQNTLLSKKAKKLSTIGIILSIVLFVVTILLTVYISKNLPNFPTI
ncbi:MAG: DUF4190 domain-containing protein [Nanoarchaeota archaeon]|nr:hypothetical protein [Nanoarchaeota archaeon]